MTHCDPSGDVGTSSVRRTIFLPGRELTQHGQKRVFFVHSQNLCLVNMQHKTQTGYRHNNPWGNLQDLFE